MSMNHKLYARIQLTLYISLHKSITVRNCSTRRECIHAVFVPPACLLTSSICSTEYFSSSLGIQKNAAMRDM